MVKEIDFFVVQYVVNVVTTQWITNYVNIYGKIALPVYANRD